MSLSACFLPDDYPPQKTREQLAVEEMFAILNNFRTSETLDARLDGWMRKHAALANGA